MAAYGAVVSLLQTIDTILQPGGLRVPHNKTQLRSLHEKVSFLLDFLEKSSSYGKSKVSAPEILEMKIRDAACEAEDIIESNISNNLFAEPNTISFGVPTGISYVVFLLCCVIIFILNANLILASVQQLLLGCVQILPTVMHVIPIAIQSLVAAGFKDVIFFMAKILIPFMVDISVPLLILSSIIAVVAYLMHPAMLKGTSFVARYWLYGFWPARRDLLGVMDDIALITEEVIEIMGECGAGEGPGYQNLMSTASSSRRDSGGSGKNVVVGLENDLLEIKRQLCSCSSKIEVVAVVGMGGIGKTTLARQVYDDSYIVHHFYRRAWVTVSQEYSLRQVLLGLLDSGGMLTENISGNSEVLLSECLYKSLKGRRYLIVMDDVWDTKIWDAVKRSFPEDNNGSRVVLTTRLSEVALYSSLHRMRFLNQDESWKLLCSEVFGEKDCPSELEVIGKEIARNCEGLPLAITVIGGLLSKVSRKRKSWKSIADNLSSVVAKDDEQCIEILSLSYKHLPHCLRACFLYMGVFPEDYEIPVSKLIRLWAAEGFLKPSRSESLEELAEEYLEDLVDRNLILVRKRSPNGRIKTCNIHDLLRNLCIQKGEEENMFNFIKNDKDINVIGLDAVRRFSILPDMLQIHSEALEYRVRIKRIDYSCNPIAHSVLCIGARPIFHSSLVYLDYILLRVLDLCKVLLSYFPDKIFDSVHLRYLALTCTTPLPPSISKLWNLQTLVLHNWRHHKCPDLPVEIWMMPKLRHLCVTPAYLPGPHLGILLKNPSLLENLQTLSEIRNFKCRKSILRRAPNLKQLEISYNVSPSMKWSEYQLEALVHLHELETLKILIKNPHGISNTVYPPKLAFPQKLRRLTLCGCGIPWESMTIVGALKNLEVLKLRRNACRGTEWKPVDGQFCKLKYLLLEEIDLVNWEADESHFPLLEHLVIRFCYKLNEIPSGIGEIPTLQMIKLVGCHPSAVTSAEQLQEEQKIMGNDDLKVQVDSGDQLKLKFYNRDFR